MMEAKAIDYADYNSIVCHKP